MRKVNPSSFVLISTDSTEHILHDIEQTDAGLECLYLGRVDGSRHWPDGEPITFIPDIEKTQNADVVVLMSGQRYPAWSLLQTSDILDALNDPLKVEGEKKSELKYTKLEKPRSIRIFTPYYPCQRQELNFRPGDIVKAEKIIKEWVEYYGVKEVFTIDPHFKGNEWVEKYPLVITDLNEELMDFIKIKSGNSEGLVPLGIDDGAGRRYGIPFMSKERKGGREVEYGKVGKGLSVGELRDYVDGKYIMFPEDATSTGSTLIKGSEFIMENCEPRGIYASVTHTAKSEGLQAAIETGNFGLIVTTDSRAPSDNLRRLAQTGKVHIYKTAETVYNTLNSL